MIATNRRGFLQGMAAAGAASTLGLTSCGKPGRLMVIVHGLVVPVVYDNYEPNRPALVFYFPAFKHHIPAAGSFRREQLISAPSVFRLEGVQNGNSARDFSKELKGTLGAVVKKGATPKVYIEAMCFSKIVAPIPDHVHGLREVRIGQPAPSSEAVCDPNCANSQYLYADPDEELENNKLTSAHLVKVFEYTTTGNPRLTTGKSDFWQDSSVHNLHLFNEPFFERLAQVGHATHCQDLFKPALTHSFACPSCTVSGDAVENAEWGIDREETQDFIERHKGVKMADDGMTIFLTGDPANCMAPTISCQDCSS